MAVLSDTHGNLPALEAVLADVHQHGVDGIVVAGDLVGGPQAVETIRRLRSLDAWMIRGNSDTYLLRYDAGDAPDGWRTSRQWAPMRWGYRHVDRDTLTFIKSLPEQRTVALHGTAPIRVVHGSPQNPSQRLFPDRDPARLRLFREAGLLAPDRDPPELDRAVGQIGEPVLICGHTHIPWQQELASCLVLNPGAVCGPLDGEVCAQYALLIWRGNRWQAEHRAVSYDLDRIRVAFRESGLLEEGGAMARAVLQSIETGRNVAEAFLSYARRLAREAGCETCEFVPDGIWERAASTFDWDGAAAAKVRIV